MSYYIQRDGESKPVTLDNLKEMIANGSLRPDEYVYDGAQWVGATQVAALADAWKSAQGGGKATPNMAANKQTKSKKRSSKKFSETSWFMSAVTYEEGGLTPSEMPEMDVGDKFANLPPVPDELRQKFSLSVSEIDDKKKK